MLANQVHIFPRKGIKGGSLWQDSPDKVVDIYDIEKTGTAEIIKNKNTTTLTLITCRHNTNKQIVIICEMV